MMAATGPPGLFVFTGGVTAGLAAFLVFRMTRREPLPAEDQTPFSAMPTTTPAIAELDPRTKPEEELSVAPVEEPEVLDWRRIQASRLPWSVR